VLDSCSLFRLLLFSGCHALEANKGSFTRGIYPLSPDGVNILASGGEHPFDRFLAFVGFFSPSRQSGN
jgi:hypothetical protein